MTTSEIAKKMIDHSEGNLHDINHFLKVYAYAKILGDHEALTADGKETLEIAALLHDIACPLCRKKYGNTNGKNQEKEGVILAAEFLKDTGIAPAQRDRVIYLVGHHHTLTEIDGLDHQILIEADYLVNTEEGGYSKDHIRNTLSWVFQTKIGIALLKSIYQV